MRGNILNMTIRIKDRENIKKRQILLKNPENVMLEKRKVNRYAVN